MSPQPALQPRPRKSGVGANRLTTVLFDIDGTLVDSNDAHAHAWVAAFATEGILVEFASVRRCIGMGADKLMPAAAGIDRESPQGMRVVDQRAHIFRERYLPLLRPMPGAGDLVQRVSDEGFTVVAASSAEREELARLLEIAAVSHLFDEAASSGDAKESKPDPDIIHGALKKASAGPDEAVLIGDTPYDVEAGRRAGVRTIAVRCGGWDDVDLAGAIKIYDGPADLVARFTASPLCVRR